MYQTHITGKSSVTKERRGIFAKMNKLFLLIVVIPTVASAIYFLFLASDVYISHSQFVVRSPDKPSATGLGVLLKSAGFSTAGDETFATQDYVRSRDALRELNRKGAVVRIFTKPGVSVFDRFNALGWNGTFEDLYEYYQNKVGVEYDPATSITTLTTKAFTGADAMRINRQLLAQAEGLVNRLNTRGQTDLIEFAEREAEEAQNAGRRASQALAAYRNQAGVIDPERQATIQLQMVSKLQDELIGARTQLAQLRSLAPENPQIPLLENRIASLSREVDVASGRVAGSRSSLSAAAVRYQRLQLERDYADRRLTAALTSLQDARNEARRKQAYVERIVEADLPDEAQEPRRLRGIAGTFAFGLILWAIMTMLIAGIREHGQ